MQQRNQAVFNMVTSGIKTSLRKAVPFVRKKDDWSVGIYLGDSPFTLASPKQMRNPVLTAAHVTDVHALFIADPFMVKEGSTWYLFAEILDADTDKGLIGLATSSDGLRWSYDRVILAEPYHLSYPHVFKWQNEYYMTPESHTNAVRLYRATDFPLRWSFDTTLLEGADFADPTLFYFDEMWWMFVGTNTYWNDTLHLYYADDLRGPWHAHPQSPVITGNSCIARPAGRVLIYQNRVFRFAQDGYLRYGHQVHMFEVTELTPTTYREQPVGDGPLLSPDSPGWNAHGMHQVDIQQLNEKQWIACVDGYKRRPYFKF